jgi:hypothetical protein
MASQTPAGSSVESAARQVTGHEARSAPGVAVLSTLCSEQATQQVVTTGSLYN